MKKHYNIDSSFLLERFLNYISIDTGSDPSFSDTPSSRGQAVLARQLADELTGMGLEDVEVDGNSYVMAGLPSNTGKNVPVIGFIAHLDTSPEVSGNNIKAVIHKDYRGGDLVLNKEKNIVMSNRDFPVLKKYRGQSIISSDGTSLLGADNKAGIAEIMAALKFLTDNPRLPRANIRVAFTPDEEIGRGADFFNVEGFGADFAYTVDGGGIGELQYENFNAAYAKIVITGRNIHPGDARGKMVNACRVGMELDGLLPAGERPEHTEGYEGFFHLYSFRAGVETAVMEYIIRDHSNREFDKKKEMLRRAVGAMNEKHGGLHLELRDQYYNMVSRIIPVMHVVELAKKAMEQIGVRPVIIPIRGGTDGARLSHMGLPCPNIFCGGHNYHGRFEFIPVESMLKATEVIVKISELAAG